MLILHLISPLFAYFLITAVFSICFPTQPLLSTMLGAIAAMPLLFYFYRKGKGGHGFLEPFPSLDMVIYLAMVGIGGCIFVNNMIMASGIAKLFPGFRSVAKDLYQPPIGLQVAAAGFLIPAAEELIFRGVAFQRMRKVFGFSWAALGSSLYFAIYHGNLVQGIYAFVLGMAFALAYERCATVLAPYVCHVAANLASILITYVSARNQAGNIYLSSAAATALAAGIMAAGLWLLYYKKKLKGEKS